MISSWRGSRSSKQSHRPLLQRLGQQRVVGVGERAHGQVPGLVPAEVGLVEQDAHQLGDRDRRVRVVELDGDLVGQRVPVVVAAAEAGDDVGQRAGDQEVFLQEAQQRARARWSRRDRGRASGSRRSPCCSTAPTKSPLLNSPKSNAVGRRGAPQPQGVDRPAAVADHGPVVGDAEQYVGLSAHQALAVRRRQSTEAFEPHARALVAAAPPPTGRAGAASGPGSST